MATKSVSRPGPASQPLTPLRISSPAAALSKAMTAQPLAMASVVTLPKVSVRLGKRKRSRPA